MSPEDTEKTKQLALQLAQWDRHIVEVSAITVEQDNDQEKLDLICSFNPEPISDAVGFFWISNLLTRMEFETLDERLGIQQSFDLGFKIGQEVFLPYGKILRTMGDHTILWAIDEK